MKKIIFFLTMISVAFYACEPMEDIYSEMEENDPAKAADVVMALTEDDYAAIDAEFGVGGYGNFESSDEAKEYIPYILDSHFPNVANTSSALVTYNLYRGTNSAIFDYTDADTYEVTDADYVSLGGDAADYKLFTKNQAPQFNIPSILENSATGYEDGDMLLVSYQYAEEVSDPSVNLTMDGPEYQVLVDYTEAQLGEDWIGTYGDQDFYYGSGAYYKNFEARINTRKEWITENSLDDDLFEGSASAQEDSLRIEERIQEGIVKFLELEYPNAVAQINGVDVFYNISYKVYYGSATITWYVQYQSDDAGSFDMVLAPSTNEIPSSSVSENRGAYYTLEDGEWEPVSSGVYYLSSANYDAMGEPGQYDNFSSSLSPDTYLPAYLNMNYPYAQEEDEMIIVYKYFTSGQVVNRGDFYIFTNGSWEKYQTEITETMQFGKENGVWVPDNTIKYQLTPQDYTAIAENDEIGNESARSNLDSFGNFNTNGGYWTKEDIVAGINYILLQMNPSAAEGQKYLVTYDTYPAGLQTVHVILTDGVYVEVE